MEAAKAEESAKVDALEAQLSLQQLEVEKMQFRLESIEGLEAQVSLQKLEVEQKQLALDQLEVKVHTLEAQLHDFGAHNDSGTSKMILAQKMIFAQAQAALKLAEAAAAEAASEEAVAEKYLETRQDQVAKEGTWEDGFFESSDQALSQYKEAAVLQIQALQRGRKARREVKNKKAYFDEAKRYFDVERIGLELTELQAEKDTLETQLRSVQLKASLEAAEYTAAKRELEQANAALEEQEQAAPQQGKHREIFGNIDDEVRERSDSALPVHLRTDAAAAVSVDANAADRIRVLELESEVAELQAQMAAVTKGKEPVVQKQESELAAAEGESHCL